MNKEIYIDKHSELWKHTKMRIDSAKSKAKDDEDFQKKMVTRLLRIKHDEKVYYAIAYLRDCKYDQVVEIYEGKILMDQLTL
jgi:hypothetical protein